LSGLDRSTRGFSLVELLIALAISGILLVALAAAFKASAVNYRENEDIFKAVNTARAALTRITSQLRTASAVSVGAPVNQCSLITSEGADITYHYNSADNKLYLITNDDPADDDYVLCDNVAAMSFSKDTDTDGQGVQYVKSVQVSITVTRGRNLRTMSTAALIRRNL